MAGFPLRRHTRPLVLAGIAAVVLTACGESGFTYHKSPDNKAFFRVPSEWTMFQKRDLLIAAGQSLSSATQERFPWMIGFDANDDPEIANVLEIASSTEKPVVMAQVQRLTFSQHDRISLSGLRNVVYPVDELLDLDAAEILDYEELVLDGGLRGIRVEFDVLPEGISNVRSGTDVIRVSQTAILDPATELMYLLVVRCESHCYRDNARTIDQIVESWTVKER